jgi:hypothetical protein
MLKISTLDHMATMNFSVPDDVRAAFNKAFAGTNKSALLTGLIRQAVEASAPEAARALSSDCSSCAGNSSRSAIPRSRERGGASARDSAGRGRQRRAEVGLPPPR